MSNPAKDALISDIVTELQELQKQLSNLGELHRSLKLGPENYMLAFHQLTSRRAALQAQLKGLI